MNAYLAIAIFVCLSVLIAYFSKESFKRSIVKEHSEAYYQSGWKKFGVRTNYYRLAIGLAGLLTIAIVVIVKLIEKSI